MAFLRGRCMHMQHATRCCRAGGGGGVLAGPGPPGCSALQHRRRASHVLAWCGAMLPQVCPILRPHLVESFYQAHDKSLGQHQRTLTAVKALTTGCLSPPAILFWSLPVGTGNPPAMATCLVILSSSKQSKGLSLHLSIRQVLVRNTVCTSPLCWGIHCTASAQCTPPSSRHAAVTLGTCLHHLYIDGQLCLEGDHVSCSTLHSVARSCQY